MLSFFVVALSVWTLMNAYVFWHLSGLPWFASGRVRRRWVWLAALPLLFAYFGARMAYSRGWEGLGLGLEVVGSSWIGCVLLFLSCFLVLDLLTLFGLLFRAWRARLRLVSASAAILMSVIALIQGSRDPVVEQYEVSVPNLPPAMEGMRVALLSDLHLGTRFDAPWLARLAARVDLEKPQLILLAGDIIDGDVRRVRPMSGAFAGFRAPLGVWGVLGNHDVYSGPDSATELLRGAGVHMLLDESVLVAPGLRLAGVADLGASRGMKPEDRVRRALAGSRPGEACIYLCHTPMLAELAGSLGAGLMVSGHTHAGQIWPFGYLVRARFPLFNGLYRVGDLRVFVSRGAGGWGPRMRLWQPGQACLLILRRG